MFLDHAFYFKRYNNGLGVNIDAYKTLIFTKCFVHVCVKMSFGIKRNKKVVIDVLEKRNITYDNGTEKYEIKYMQALKIS